MIRPRIFVSACTSEFATLRAKTATVLRELGYEPVDEAIFGLEPGDLTPMLRKKIDDCHGLIQLVGDAYGAEPPLPNPQFGRVSYTQGEFLYAKQRGLKTWLVFPGPDCTRSQKVEQLDLPDDPNHSDGVDWQQVRRQLQADYSRELRASDQTWYDATDDTQLELLLHKLNPEFARLRRLFRWWMAAALGLLVLIAGGVAFSNIRQQVVAKEQREEAEKQQIKLKEIADNQRLNRERIRAYLFEIAGQVKQAALDEVAKQPGWEERERLREAAESAHQQTLKRIDWLVEDFARIEGTAEANSVFEELQRILGDRESKDPLAETFAFLERRRSGAFDRIDERIEQNRNELRPYLAFAELKAVNGQIAAARTEFEGLLKKDAVWPELLERFSWFLYDMSIASERHGSVTDAVADAEQMLMLAERLNQSPMPTSAIRRLLTTAHAQCGDVLMKRGQPGDTNRALQNYIRCDQLLVKLLEDNPDGAEVMRDVSVNLNKLGNFLAQRGQPGDADQALQHFTRSLKLREELFDKDPKSAHAARDVSVSLNTLGNFLVQRGQPRDADTAMLYFTRSLEMRDKLLRENPDSKEADRDYAITLAHVAMILINSGDVDKAHDYLQRCNATMQERFQDNPNSAQAARDFSASSQRLGDFLLKRGKPGDAKEAQGHFTRCHEALETLLQKNAGSAQAARDVSVSLDRLGDFLANRGQPGDAEKAMLHYTRSLELRERLLDDNRSSAAAERDVTLSLARLGDLLVGRGLPGDAEKALQHFTRSLALCETLYLNNPTSAQAAGDFASSLETLGVFLAQRGQPGDAEKAMLHVNQALELNDNLLTDNPDSAAIARNVVQSHLALELFYSRSGDKTSAKKHRRACYDLLHQRVSRGMTFDWQIVKVYEALRVEFGEIE